MGWLNKISPLHGGRGPLMCSKPDSKAGTAFAPGSVWQCDDCSVRWRFEGCVAPGEYRGEPTSGSDRWTHIAPLALWQDR